MEHIIQTRYPNIFRFFNSKYSPPVSIHLLHRFNSDSNLYFSSLCEIAFSAGFVAVLMVKMSLKNIRSTSILGIERNYKGPN